MDLAMDGYVTVPLLFTVLAVIIASLYLKFRPTDAGVKEESGTPGKVDGSQADEEKKPNVEGKEGGEGDGRGGEGGEGDGESLKPEGLSGEKSGRRPPGSETRAKEKVTVEEIGPAEAASAHSGEETLKKSESEETPREEKTPPAPGPPGERQEPSPEEKLRKEEDIKVENTKTSLPAEDNEDLVDDTLKYSPGKIRGSHYEKTLTREELEEEQRVQREQLAAIFRLMEENKETFGDMTDGDMEDQLKLYSL